MDKELIPSSNQNPITGDHMITKASNETYRNGWDRIFGEKKAQKDPNDGSSDPNDGSKAQSPPSTEDSEVFETTEELYKSWGYYDWSKEASLDAPQQSNQTCEDCPQEAEAEDLCSESTCAVRSGLLNRN